MTLEDKINIFIAVLRNLLMSSTVMSRVLYIMLALLEFSGIKALIKHYVSIFI